MRISQAVIERALRADLPALIEANGTKLKKVGTEHKGLCPFHDEKTPSFQVNPQKGLYHCFGCGAAGNAITFLVKHKQMTFPAAVNELLQRQGTSLAALEPPAVPTVKRPAAARAAAKVAPSKPPAKAATSSPSPASADVALPATPAPAAHTSATPSRSELLQQALAYYRRTFAGTPTGAAYLAGRGIKSRELFETFQIGYADGTLPGTLSKGSATRAGLREAGLLTAAGREFFAGCVVFPLLDDNRRCVGMYGRRVKGEAGKPNHLYLPGPHRGLFNREAAKRSKRVILTESVIDALSGIARGCDNIIPLYGTNGLTEEHIELLRAEGTAEIVFAFDADAAGEAAIPRTMQRLAGLPLSYRKVALPAGEDINDYIRKHANGSLAELVERAAPIGYLPDGGSAAGPAAGTSSVTAVAGATPTAAGSPAVVEYVVMEDGSEITLTAGELEYTVRGLNYYGFTRMKVTVRARRGPALHIDTLDLYANRQRAGFINQCAKRLGVEVARVEADLFQLLRELERIREKHVTEEKGKNKIEIPPMSEDGRAAALRFLGSPDLAREIVADMTTLGYVGEETNKLIGYLVSVSRKLAEPLSCIVISRSGAGKSELMEKVEQMTPPEDLVQFSALTPQALYYMEPDALVHKLLLIEERAGSDQADYSIRELQTKKVLRKGVPIKDPATGKITTVRLEVNGPIAYMESTTNHSINPENSSRCFLLHIDESLQQTKKIHEAQRRARTLAGLEQRLRAARLIEKHQNAQRLLEPVAVFNPFCEHLDFPTDRLRTRRDHQRFLNLIEAVTFLHQQQRPRREATDKTTGEVITYVESTAADYAVAYGLIKAILPATLDELPKGSRDLLALARELCRVRAKGAGAGTGQNETEITFTRRELREHSRWSNDQIKDHIRKLEELEYLVVVKGCKGQQYVYQLTTAPTTTEELTAQIPTPEELQKRLKTPPARLRKVG